MNRKLSPQEAAFCRAYVLECDRNGAEAARKAGYAEGSARISAAKLLKRPHVMAEIRRLEAEALKRSGLVSNLLTSANVGADRSTPTSPGSIADQIRTETDADMIAATARAYILAVVKRNMEICAGERKRTVSRRVKGEIINEEVYDPNPSAANQAAQILLAAPEISGKGNEAATPEDARTALREALKEFDR
jgi:hypothetical protein